MFGPIRCFRASFLIPFFFGPSVATPAQQFIARNGMPQATIVAHLGRFPSAQAASEAADRIGSAREWLAASPQDRVAFTEAFAALELRAHLCRMAGLDAGNSDLLPILDVRATAPGTIISLGDPASNPRARSAYAQLDPGNVVVEAGRSPEGFYLYSQEDAGGGVLLIRGDSPLRTLYGVYAFLESLGIRWLSPDSRDTIVPHEPTIRLGSIDWGEAPAMLYRQLYANIQSQDFYLWMVRNRLNGYAAGQASYGFLHKLGMMSAVAQHSFFSDLVPANNYGAHPEWFGLDENGKRNRADQPVYNVNYCTSNLALVAELKKNFIQAVTGGKWKDTDIVEVWGFDGGKWCGCNECRSLGSASDRLLNVVYHMQRAMAEARRAGLRLRDIRLFLLSYQETLEPPSRPLPADFDFSNVAVTFFPIRRCYHHWFGDPDCTELNRYYDMALRGWTAPGGHYRGPMIIGEYYNLSGFREFPVLFMNGMAKDIPYFAERRTAGMNYMLCPARAWGHRALTNYQLARQMWNPRVNVKRLWDDYFQTYYGPAATPMRDYYTALEQTMSNATAWRYDLWQKLHVVNRNPEIPLFPIGNIPPIPWYGKQNFPGSKDAGIDVFLGFPERSVVSDHLRFERFTPVQNDAPDWVEIMESLARTRQAIDQALHTEAPEIVKSRMAEDEYLFRYGELGLHLYDHVIRMVMASQPDQQRTQWRAAQPYRERLRNYTFGGPAPASETSNGLLGVGLDPLLKEYGKRLGLE